MNKKAKITATIAASALAVVMALPAAVAYKVFLFVDVNKK